MFLFNEAIDKLGLIELPLHGRHFTWTNKQFPPLLERLDWFFTSASWTINYPNTLVKTLVMETSDHWPCIVEISTRIPQSKIFRFENHWLNHQDFISVAINGWRAPDHISDSAKIITAKCKNLRRDLKVWKTQLPKLALVIESIKLVLHFLETVELFRDLSLPEWNFRDLISAKLISLLKQQKTYWKQRGKIRWVKEGDAGTKFFHAHATIRHRKNTITTLQDGLGNIFQHHEQKAELLWNAFKERMGMTDFNYMIFNLGDFIQPVEELEQLELPFTKEEVDEVVSNLPNNKSPGPDGYSNEFLKGCWPLIANDFYKLCEDFFSGEVCLQSINRSYIALIPKKEGPQRVSDYRPISLLSTSIKLLTKLMANRLQKPIMKIIHKNQYGFIKTRTIQDCLAQMTLWW